MKKTYRGFVLWLLGWLLLMLAVPFVPGDAALAVRLIFNLMTLGMAVLTHMICRNECVYWYTGISFEEAEAAGSERRLAYARATRKPFLRLAAGALLLTGAAQLLGWNMWIDFTAVCAGTLAAALSTTRLRL